VSWCWGSEELYGAFEVEGLGPESPWDARNLRPQAPPKGRDGSSWSGLRKICVSGTAG
jgi:hypothetical protein